jgi:hypothetical protein
MKQSSGSYSIPGRHFLLIMLLLIFAIPNTYGQYKISGTVESGGDNKPVQSASVFISNTTIGGATDRQGKFTFNNIKPGDYTIVVNALGYYLFTTSVHISNADVTVPVIHLSVSTTDLKEINVSASNKKDNDYNWAYQTFLNEFLGTSDMAKDCKITNPEVLNLDYDVYTNRINASSDDFLRIENNSLGYIIQYKLNDFKLINDPQAKSIHYDGVALFTEMKGSPRQQRRWLQNRQTAYEGSFMHFLRSLLNDNLDKEGFKVLRLAVFANPGKPAPAIISAKVTHFKALLAKRNSAFARDSLAYWNKKEKLPDTVQQLYPYPLKRNDLLTNTANPSFLNFSCDNDDILVMYDRSRDFPQTNRITNLNNLNFLINKADNYNLTLVNFVSPFAIITNNGGIINPNSLQLGGGWINKRVADLLPADYEEHGNKTDNAAAPDTVLKNIVARINNDEGVFPQEKVYLHVDRDTYVPGDTVWFKAYVLGGPLHQSSSISGILHCEVVNEKDSIVADHLLKITNGLAQGDFNIPVKARSGKYTIRAYTNWMRNAGDYYTKTLNIIGAMQTPQGQPVASPVQPDVQFFPEGGDMIDGVKNKVAVKVIGLNGLGEDASVKVTDEDGGQVAYCKTRHLGMGSFMFTPAAAKKYKAIVTCADSSKYTFQLPDVQKEGFILNVFSNKDSLYARLATNKKTFESHKNGLFYLLIQEGGKLYSSIPVNLAKQTQTVAIEKKRFPTGIVQITLMSATEEPLNERLVFVRNNDIAAISLTSDSRIYTTRQKVQINVGTNTDGQLLRGDYSVSVVNQSRTPLNDSTGDNILSSLLLTSDLAGHVEQPGYYFAHDDDETNGNLDLLLLTQGYRRFEWKQVLSPLAPAPGYKPENQLFLSGTVKTVKGKFVPFSKVVLTAPASNFLLDTIADANGNFMFDGLDFPDSTELLLKASKGHVNTDDLRIVIDKYNSPGFAAKDNDKTLPDYSTAVITNMLKDANIRFKNDSLIKGRMLKEVKVKAVVSKPRVDLSSSTNLNGPGKADQIIMGDQVAGCVNLADCLNGKVPGVSFVNNMAYSNRHLANLSPYMSDGKKRAGGGPVATPLTIIVDGKVMGSLDMSFINTSDIYSIEILKSGAFTAMYGSSASRGAIIITMKRGGEYSKTNDITAPGLTRHFFDRYYKARIFYSPKYGAGNSPAQLPDARTTIYWNPDLVIGPDGKTSFEFYNADTKGTYCIILEGMDANGNPGRQVYKYQVK